MNNATEIIIDGPVAYMASSNAAVYFSKSNTAAGSFSTIKSTALPIKKLQNLLDVALWGEDNRFPQNIEQQMAYCSIGKSLLDRRARKLWGNGILPGKIVDFDDDGNEIFKPLKPSDNIDLHKMINSPLYYRFWLEYMQDWSWFSNCFPEIILSKDCSKITGFVHQESCDARFKQMNEKGEISHVYLSKMWGMSGDQYAKFDPKKKMKGLTENPTNLENASLKDNPYIKSIHCIDMYDPVDSLKKIADQIKSKGNTLKSAILPVNYPSPNKTYYQVPVWDGARLGGWIEIACKIPAMIKALYSKAFNIKYHILIPETFFHKKYGVEFWENLDTLKKEGYKKKLLKEMNDFLSGEENAYKTFISFFDVDPHTGEEYGLIKIEPIKNENGLDKELMTTSAANVEISIAMGVHPSEISAGSPGSTHRSGGGSGSDIREAGLMNNAILHLERQVLMAPLYLARDFNGWDEDITFRVRDVVLTTLDKGTGSLKKVS